MCKGLIQMQRLSLPKSQPAVSVHFHGLQTNVPLSPKVACLRRLLVLILPSTGVSWFLLVLFQQAANFLVGGIFASVAVFAVFIIVLLARPEGLAGAAVQRRV